MDSLAALPGDLQQLILGVAGQGGLRQVVDRHQRMILELVAGPSALLGQVVQEYLTIGHACCSFL